VYNEKSIMKNFETRVPASTGNIGPAFDCLGLALDLWNDCSFSNDEQEELVAIKGEGQEILPNDSGNLIIRSMQALYKQTGNNFPDDLHLKCTNRIPLGSGLGSSSAAIVTGLLGANHLMDSPLSSSELIEIAADIEGHADNAAPSFLGGLVLVLNDAGNLRSISLPIQQLHCIILLPEIDLSTEQSRQALEKSVTLESAVFNIGHSLWLARALESGDLEQLRGVMQDQLHQEQRLKLIPGAEQAIAAAQQAGSAATLAGAGPSILAFVEEGREKELTEILSAPFAERDIQTRHYLLSSSAQGAEII
jgi:homoserine kinase